jgi:hypothetical protein
MELGRWRMRFAAEFQFNQKAGNSRRELPKLYLQFHCSPPHDPPNRHGHRSIRGQLARDPPVPGQEALSGPTPTSSKPALPAFGPAP